MDEYRAEIRFDLRRFCGVSLSDVWSGSVSVSEALDLIHQLPEESRYAGAIRDRGDSGWSYDRYVLTLSANMLMSIFWVTANQNLPEGERSKPFDLLPIPGAEPVEPEESVEPANPFLAMLEQAKESHRAKRNQELMTTE